MNRSVQGLDFLVLPCPAGRPWDVPVTTVPRRCCCFVSRSAGPWPPFPACGCRTGPGPRDTPPPHTHTLYPSEDSQCVGIFFFPQLSLECCTSLEFTFFIFENSRVSSCVACLLLRASPTEERAERRGSYKADIILCSLHPSGLWCHLFLWSSG